MKKDRESELSSVKKLSFFTDAGSLSLKFSDIRYGVSIYRDRTANDINILQSRRLTSALTSFIRFIEQKWIRASCSACQRGSVGNIISRLGGSWVSPDRLTKKCSQKNLLCITSVFLFASASQTYVVCTRFKRGAYLWVF